MPRTLIDYLILDSVADDIGVLAAAPRRRPTNVAADEHVC
jgi:hypothetical protein